MKKKTQIYLHTKVQLYIILEKYVSKHVFKESTTQCRCLPYLYTMTIPCILVLGFRISGLQRLLTYFLSTLMYVLNKDNFFFKLLTVINLWIRLITI